MLSDIIIKLSETGQKIIVYPTQAPKDATRRIKEIDNTYTGIICSGGDGTLDEVVKGMMEAGIKLPLGYIPSGTVNDFASTIGISSNTNEAINSAVNGKDFKIDIGKFNNDYFTYVAAFGAFTSVPYTTDQETKNYIGKMAYFAECMRQLNGIESCKATIIGDNVEVTGDYILGLITNSSSIGGIKTSVLKDTELNDGLFEVTLVRNPASLTDIGDSLLPLIGNDFSDSKGLLYHFKTSTLKIKFEAEVSWTLDGEDGGKHSEVSIYNIPEALTIKI